jgi:hypothetical protein
LDDAALPVSFSIVAKVMPAFKPMSFLKCRGGKDE